MDFILNILLFFLIMGVLISIHEFGHFIMAKTFGVFCAEFSIGMGPLIWSKQGKETMYSLRALPIGGYVAMAGEADQEDNEAMKDVPFERTLKGIKTWQQVVVMLAGVTMNFILGIVLIVCVYATNAYVQTNSNAIGSLVSDGVAINAGILENDVIQKITVVETGQEYLIGSFSDIGEALSTAKNQQSTEKALFEIEVMRGSNVLTFEVELPYVVESEKYILGVSPTYRRATLVESIKYGSQDFMEMCVMIIDTIGKLFTDSKNTINQMSGPVGIFQVTSEVRETGQLGNILMLMASLSVNLGVFNLMPIPGLDGSQVLFALVERAIGREIPTKLRYALQLAGLALVFGLIIFVTMNDISRLF